MFLLILAPRQFVNVSQNRPQQSQNDERNLNQNNGQKPVDRLYCYKCAGKSYEECTQLENLTRCQKDQNVCMIEMRTQGDRVVSRNLSR